MVGDHERAAEVDERQPECLRERLRDLALGGEARLDDERPEALARRGHRRGVLQGERLLHLLLGEQPLLDEDLADAAPAARVGRVRPGSGRSHVHSVGASSPEV